MVTSQQVIERSLYVALLRVALSIGRTINPEDYLPVSTENQKRQEEDIKKLGKNYIAIYGVGNNQARGVKTLPRITIELTGYYPGDVGVEQFMIGNKEENEQYALYEQPWEVKDSIFDIHLVAGNANDMRVLHQIMYTALPARGYIKPFTFNTIKEYLENPGLEKTGNLFLNIGNYYDHNDTDHGILEKVYTYNCVDGLLEQIKQDPDISPIKEIKTDLIPDGTNSISFTGNT